MALKREGIEFLLGLNPKGFFTATKSADKEHDRLKGKVEKPLDMKANISNVLGGFAKLGLAINGIRQTFGLFTSAISNVTQLSDIQEKAEQRLAISLKSAGDATQETLKNQMEFASWIQSVTTVGDEQSLMLQSMALNMGATVDQTKEVVKNAIALSKAYEIDMNVAIRASVAALQGNFSMLTRYIPALRTATNEVEKHAIFQKTVANGWKTATGELNTAAGAAEDFKNSLGDLKEDIGDAIKDFLVPMIKLLKPLVAGLTELSPATRNAGIAFLGFIAVTQKVRVAVLGLQASMGPTGWLLLGLSALTTAFAIYSNSAETAASKNELLSDSNDTAADSFENVKNRALAAARALSLEQLIKKQGEFNKLLDEQILLIARAKLKGKQDAEAAIDVELARKRLAEIRANLAAVDQAISEAQEERTEKTIQLTEQEQKKLDELREFQFETNRITLADYVAYLESRREELRASLGAESVEFLKFTDKLSDLQQRLRDEQAAGESNLQIFPDALEVRRQGDEAIEAAAEPLLELAEVQTTFEEDTFAALKDAFEERNFLLDENIERARIAYGEDSDEFREQVRRKLEAERNFQEARRRMAIAGARQTIELGAQLVGAFQGQSKVLFGIGKGLAIAQATIHLHEAIQRAFKDYPWPFNIAVAAIQGALAAAEIIKIQGTQFTPAGKQLGGLIRSEDIFKTVVAPTGEDGIIAAQVGEFVINRRATERFLPLLEAINAGKIRTAAAPTFQQGGGVAVPQSNFQQPAFVTQEDFGRFIDAVRQMRIEIRSDLDAIQFFRRNFQRWQKIDAEGKL